MPSLGSKLINRLLRLFRYRLSVINDTNIHHRRKQYHRVKWLFPMPFGMKVDKIKSLRNAEYIHNQHSRTDAIIMFITGGGFVFDSSRLQRATVAKLVKESGIGAVNVSYRLAPEHPYPANAEDLLEVYTYLLKKYGAQNIVLLGDSAGGGLSLVLMHTIVQKKLELPSAIVLCSPATDATFTSKSIFENTATESLLNIEMLRYFVDSYYSTVPTNHPIASPIHGDFYGFPPMFILVSKHELLYHESTRLAEKARTQGVEVTLIEHEHMPHSWFHYWLYMPEARQAIRQISEFIQKRLD